jgi:hypothetical protein
VENFVIRTRPLGEEEVTALGISEFLKLESIRESVVGLNPQLDRGRGFIRRIQQIQANIQVLYNLEKDRSFLRDLRP